MSWSIRDKRIYITIAVFGLVVGLVGGFLLDKADGQVVTLAPGHPRPFSLTSRPAPISASAEQLMCRDEAPEYPGCTAAQARAREAHTRRMTRRHYGAARWGQSGHEYAGLHRAGNRKLRRLYHRAVERFVARRTTAGEAVGDAYPRYRTWKAFKAHTSCSGVFGWAVKPVGWCQLTAAFSHWRDAVEATKKLVLRCDGLVVGAVATGAAIAVWTGVAIGPAAAIAGGGAAIGCAVETIYDQLWSW